MCFGCYAGATMILLFCCYSGSTCGSCYAGLLLFRLRLVGYIYLVYICATDSSINSIVSVLLLLSTGIMRARKFRVCFFSRGGRAIRGSKGGRQKQKNTGPVLKMESLGERKGWYPGWPALGRGSLLRSSSPLPFSPTPPRAGGGVGGGSIRRDAPDVS